MIINMADEAFDLRCTRCKYFIDEKKIPFENYMLGNAVIHQISIPTILRAPLLTLQKRRLLQINM